MLKIKREEQRKKLNKNKSAVDNKSKSKIKRVNKQQGKNQGGKRKITVNMKKDPKGVVYLSHIPHGFYNDQIEGYFSQFGKVTAVSVPSSKSGRVKGYAFIEFKHPEIAKIAAETMDNYLMFNRLLRAKYIPPEQQKPHFFAKAKEALKKHQTAADRAALTVKHNRKVKNRQRKIILEAKYAKKLLKKKCALLRRGEKFGLRSQVAIGEVNLQSIFEKRKEIETNKKRGSNEENKKSEQEGEWYSSNDMATSMKSKGNKEKQKSDLEEVKQEDISECDSVSEVTEEDNLYSTSESDKDIMKIKPNLSEIQNSKKVRAFLLPSPSQNGNKEHTISVDNSVLQDKNILSSKGIAKKKKTHEGAKVREKTKAQKL